MNTTARGRAAEQLAADYLTRHGFTILDRNWRNRWCELDLVVRSATTVHIVEVKYRATADFGSAAEYVTRDKIARLTRAALAWTQAHHYQGPYQIDIIAIQGGLDHPRLEYVPNALF